MISIIVPIYNLEKELSRSLDSICTQTFTDLEIILINDGSEDGSLKICLEYANKDNRIKVFSHENHGVSYTRNRGIEESIGEYIMFIDGDDEISEDYIQQYYERIKCTNSDVVIGGLEFIINGDSETKSFDDIELSRKELISMICKDSSGLFGYVPNKIYRSSIIKEHNIRFNEKMIAQEDLDFALSIYSQINKVSLLSYVGYSYYYTFGKRHVAAESVVGNQLKLLKIAKSNMVEKNLCQLQINKIYRLIFTALFWAENTEQMYNYRKLWDEFINRESTKGSSIKVKIIVLLFKRKHYIILHKLFFLWKAATKK